MCVSGLARPVVIFTSPKVRPMTDTALVKCHRLVEGTGLRKDCTKQDLLWRFAVLDVWRKGQRTGRPVAEVASRFGKTYQAARKWIRRFDYIDAIANNGSLPLEAGNIELVHCREKTVSIAST